MKHLVIIGAGGFGREVYNTAIESIGYGIEFDVKGFIDNIYDEVGHPGYPPLLSKIVDYEIEKDDVFICALGDVNYKKKFCELIISKGGEFITFIHKTAYISMNTTLGKGCIVLADARIHCDVTIGNFVTVQPKAVIGHDVVIEDWCHINAFADCGGASHLEEGVTLHTNSFILPKVRMGAFSVLGAGSVANRNVKPGAVLFGVPARELPVPKINK
jgi:sugar O-acyltransferase (sialic acid O-acetyltransferase NeuD family)